MKVMDIIILSFMKIDFNIGKNYQKLTGIILEVYLRVHNALNIFVSTLHLLVRLTVPSSAKTP